MNIQYRYNLSGSGRKPLVEAISQILRQPAVYQGAPDFSYIIGDYTVDKNGVLSCGGSARPEAAKALAKALRGRGFAAADAAESEGTAQNGCMTGRTRDSHESGQMAAEISNEGFTPLARDNLKKIVASKETLFKQAFGTDSLKIEDIGGKIFFPWFTLNGSDGEADAYCRFIAAICNMAKKQKRVTATEKPVQNARYEMRLFLIRLGFIGDEYKTARKILLRNLTGNSSWKSGHEPKRTADAEGAEVPEVPVSMPEESGTDKNEGGDDHDR